MGRVVTAPLRFLRGIPEATLAGRFTLTFLLISFWFAVTLESNAVLLLLSCLLAALLLSALWNGLAAGSLDADRRLPERVVQGSPFRVRLALRNRSRWRPCFGLSFRDALQKDAPGEVTCGPELRVLPPGETAHLTYETRIHRRGIYEVTNALAATRFPFGLFERRILLRSPRKLVVLPATGFLGPAGRLDLGAGGAQQLQRPRRRDGTPEEFRSLREFRPGDNPRRIHWRSTARHGTLMWREYVGDEAERLLLVLDTQAEGLHAEVRRRMLERAVSCAATILVHCIREGRPVSLLVSEEQPVRVVSTAALGRAMEHLAGVRPAAVPVEQVLRTARTDRYGRTLLLSLQGPAPGAVRAAGTRGLDLKVWDVSRPDFKRYFRLR